MRRELINGSLFLCGISKSKDGKDRTPRLPYVRKSTPSLIIIHVFSMVVVVVNGCESGLILLIFPTVMQISLIISVQFCYSPAFLERVDKSSVCILVR